MKTHRDLSQVLELESPDGEWTRGLENSRMEEKLRVGEKGTRGYTREGNPASDHSRVPNGQENDPGNEQFPGGPIPVCESGDGEAAKEIRRWLGSPIHRLHRSGLFSHL